MVVRIRVFAGIWVWIFLSLLAGAAFAGPRCPPVPIKVGYLEFGVFYRSIPGANTGTGIDRDLIDELSKRSGCRFESQAMPRARLWIELQAGRTHMAPSGIRTPIRDAYYWFLPYQRTHQVVLLGPGAPSTVTTPAEFQSVAHLKFGVVRGYVHSSFYEPLIAEWKQAGRVVEYVDQSQLIDALRHGEIAAVVSSSGAYRLDLAVDADMKDIRILDWDPDNIKVVGNLMLSKARFDKAEAEKWAQLVADMRRDGTLLRIFRKYVLPDEAANMLP